MSSVTSRRPSSAVGGTEGLYRGEGLVLVLGTPRFQLSDGGEPKPADNEGLGDCSKGWRDYTPQCEVLASAVSMNVRRV